MTASTPSSCKDKGRRFQQEIAGKLIDALHIPAEDVVSRPMGSHGTDIMLSASARHIFPFAVECKRQEKFDVPAWWRQARRHAEKESLLPMLIMRQNRKEPFVMTDARVISAMEHARPDISSVMMQFPFDSSSNMLIGRWWKFATDFTPKSKRVTAVVMNFSDTCYSAVYMRFDEFIELYAACFPDGFTEHHTT